MALENLLSELSLPLSEGQPTFEETMSVPIGGLVQRHATEGVDECTQANVCDFWLCHMLEDLLRPADSWCDVRQVQVHRCSVP